MRLMLSMSFKTQLLLISKYNQYIAICIIYFPLMNLKNNIKSKQMQTVRHNPDKDSCSYFVIILCTKCTLTIWHGSIYSSTTHGYTICRSYYRKTHLIQKLYLPESSYCNSDRLQCLDLYTAERFGSFQPMDLF